MKPNSTMMRLAQDYLAYRRSLGFALRVEGQQLLKFASYADRLKHRGPLTLDLALRWARLPKKASPLYWARRLEVIRPFARYCAAFDPRTEIPPPSFLGAAHRRITPHIYTPDQIRDLIKSARALSGQLRPHTYATLIGLLACTGLRISEALHLRRDDVDLQRQIINVRRSKFQKSRLVPLHGTATKALESYVKTRDQHYHSDFFFVSDNGGPPAYSTVRQTFRKLVNQIVKLSADSQRRPRLHDLRHTFCCDRLIRWSRQRAQLDSLIPYLSTYLGHAHVTDTYWYLSGIPELFKSVGTQFQNFVNDPNR